jgi:hypothetical protein
MLLAHCGKKHQPSFSQISIGRFGRYIISQIDVERGNIKNVVLEKKE